jgi:hypothetical protein
MHFRHPRGHGAACDRPAASPCRTDLLGVLFLAEVKLRQAGATGAIGQMGTTELEQVDFSACWDDVNPLERRGRERHGGYGALQGSMGITCRTLSLCCRWLPSTGDEMASKRADFLSLRLHAQVSGPQRPV